MANRKVAALRASGSRISTGSSSAVYNDDDDWDVSARGKIYDGSLHYLIIFLALQRQTVQTGGCRSTNECRPSCSAHDSV